MNQHEKINYVEFPAKDIAATRAFFQSAFGWTFADYGPDYTAFSDAGLAGGFYRSDLAATTANGSALVVLYSENLEKTREKIQENGGKIVKPVFSFPGGRRFPFYRAFREWICRLVGYCLTCRAAAAAGKMNRLPQRRELQHFVNRLKNRGSDLPPARTGTFFLPLRYPRFPTETFYTA